MTDVHQRGATVAMNPSETAFTEYVRRLKPGVEPDRECFKHMWELLRKILQRELKRRSLWSQSPKYLGVLEASWNNAVLDELMADGYVFVFLDRFGYLKSRVDEGATIEGWVCVVLRNWIHTLQGQCDPFGSRVYELAVGAICFLDGDGRLAVSINPQAIYNDTVLKFEAGAPPPTDASDAEVAAWAPDCVDAVFPDLLTVRGKKRRAVERKLAEEFHDLAESVAPAYRFGAVMIPMRIRARDSWRAVEVTSEVARVFDQLKLGSGFETNRDFLSLVACVEEAISQSDDLRRKSREHLLNLLDFATSFALDENQDRLPPKYESLCKFDRPLHDRPSLAG